MCFCPDGQWEDAGLRHPCGAGECEDHRPCRLAGRSQRPADTGGPPCPQALLLRAVCQVRALVVLPTKELAQQVRGRRAWRSPQGPCCWCGALGQGNDTCPLPGEQGVQHLHGGHFSARCPGHGAEGTGQGAGEPCPEDVGPAGRGLGGGRYRRGTARWAAQPQGLPALGVSEGSCSASLSAEQTASAAWRTSWWPPLAAWWTTSTRPQGSASSTSASW